MIYIDNNTTGFTIPRITNGIGDKVILINQITKRRFELSTDVLNNEGYKVDITDLKLEIGQYDYVVKKNNIPLESGILQVGGYKSQNNQYEVDFNIIQYEPDIVYTPLPEKVLDVTENGVYNVESFDKVDVDVKDKESVIIIEQLENQIDTLEDEISTLEGTVTGLETEVNRLDDLKDSLQSQIDSVTTLSVTENGIYTPEEGTLGWNEVSVNIPQNTKVVLGNDIKLGYSNFTEVPDYFDFSQTTNFNSMFFYCNKLTNIPQLDTSNCTFFDNMFYACFELTEIPQLDTSKGTNFGYMFYYCSNLTTIPQLDTSKGTNFGYMFYNCSNLTTIPQLDTSKGTNFGNMFRGCDSLKTIGGLDLSKGTTFYNILGYTLDEKLVLENLTLVGSVNANIDFSLCVMLAYESVKSILTACSNTTNTNSKTVTFKRTLTDQNGELTNLISICNSKGWTISGLTLE